MKPEAIFIMVPKESSVMTFAMPGQFEMTVVLHSRSPEEIEKIKALFSMFGSLPGVDFSAHWAKPVRRRVLKTRRVK